VAGATRQRFYQTIAGCGDSQKKLVNDNSKSDPRTHTKSLKTQSLSFLPFRVIQWIALPPLRL
jgi:hypothetical protein